jgi:hypothetical protein
VLIRKICELIADDTASYPKRLSCKRKKTLGRKLPEYLLSGHFEQLILLNSNNYHNDDFCHHHYVAVREFGSLCWPAATLSVQDLPHFFEATLLPFCPNFEFQILPNIGSAYISVNSNSCPFVAHPSFFLRSSNNFVFTFVVLCYLMTVPRVFTRVWTYDASEGKFSD